MSETITDAIARLEREIAERRKQIDVLMEIAGLVPAEKPMTPPPDWRPGDILRTPPSRLCDCPPGTICCNVACPYRTRVT